MLPTYLELIVLEVKGLGTDICLRTVRRLHLAIHKRLSPHDTGRGRSA